MPGRPISDDPDEWLFHPVETGLAKHHALWLSCLQRVFDGEINRLLGLMPPGSAKSTYTSVVFPSYVMGAKPGSTLIVTNYGSDLPRKWGRKGRSIARQSGYRGIFSASLSEESHAADEWALTNGSEFMGAGILSGITGNRADGVIWDDLIKGREQADSKVIRDKTWDAYFDDLLTRKKPGAWEIGVTTRWHEDDPAGRILPEGYAGQSGWLTGRDGNRWYVVCLPAICERTDDPLGRAVGERIWPEWFGPEHFASFRRNTRTWSALYQQRPAPETGSYWKEEWLRPYTTGQEPPRATMSIYGGSDYAVTADGGDFTVHLVIGIDPEDRPWLLDLWRGRESSDVWVDRWCELVRKWKPLGWAEEKGQIKSGVGPFRDRVAHERKAYVSMESFPTRGDKGVRAQSMRGRVAQLGLNVPTDAPWYPDFRSELMSYPAGANDDQHDALGLVGQLLDKMLAGRKPKIEVPGTSDGYRSVADTGGNDTFKTL